MYVADSRGTPATPASAGRSDRSGRRAAVAPTVPALGTVSLITDVSSEMVTAVLPLYPVAGLGLSPLGFGLLDGVYNGFSALVRLVGGHLADRGGRHKTVAVLGYGLSALCKPLLQVAGSVPLIGAVPAADRTGKGLRTAPRDALISLASPADARGRAFGVHRAMDTAGVLMAAAAGAVPDGLRSSGPALVQTGQALARFGCSIAFGAAWTAWGDRTALGTATAALAVCVAVAFALLPAPSRSTAPEGPSDPKEQAA
ncbi:MFS transporter [Streptomyces showdoensis]|uniref:MFS transporter n=1 Tax=Streptomyces showdoensis TaxID=68268 RepID=A0A2P2GFV9_STREW|nr:MFS transporter [Streptomyces showdoensis]KKZ70393.1 hypothetical protein VO63_29190 [Streptomyces showdoensis]